VSSGRSSRDDRAAKAAAMRAQAARAEARRRSMIVGAAILAVIVIAVGVFAVVQNGKHSAAASGGPTPANIAAGNSIVVGKAGAPVTMIAYEDFQCPYCDQFETANATQIAAWVAAGSVRVEYRPIALLDANSTDQYSTRSLNAVAALVNSTPTAFAKYHQLLFANQPKEGGPGLTDKQLVDLAVQAGAPRASMTAAVNAGTYRAWTVRVTDAANKAKVNSTPTVKINGTTVDGGTLLNAAAFKTLVETAVTAAK
jgi:protein-disulfide isomerase